jgi:hypothetical protein
LPKSVWKIGRIEELPSTRTAKLKILPGNKIMYRAINKLYPMEIENVDEEKAQQDNEGEVEDIPANEILAIETVGNDKNTKKIVEIVPPDPNVRQLRDRRLLRSTKAPEFFYEIDINNEIDPDLRLNHLGEKAQLKELMGLMAKHSFKEDSKNLRITGGYVYHDANAGLMWTAKHNFEPIEIWMVRDLLQIIGDVIIVGYTFMPLEGGEKFTNKKIPVDEVEDFILLNNDLLKLQNGQYSNKVTYNKKTYWLKVTSQKGIRTLEMIDENGKQQTDVPGLSGANFQFKINRTVKNVIHIGFYKGVIVNPYFSPYEIKEPIAITIKIQSKTKIQTNQLDKVVQVIDNRLKNKYSYKSLDWPWIKSAIESGFGNHNTGWGHLFVDPTSKVVWTATRNMLPSLVKHLKVMKVMIKFGEIIVIGYKYNPPGAPAFNELEITKRRLKSQLLTDSDLGKLEYGYLISSQLLTSDGFFCLRICSDGYDRWIELRKYENGEEFAVEINNNVIGACFMFFIPKLKCSKKVIYSGIRDGKLLKPNNLPFNFKETVETRKAMAPIELLEPVGTSVFVRKSQLLRKNPNQSESDSEQSDSPMESIRNRPIPAPRESISSLLVILCIVFSFINGSMSKPSNYNNREQLNLINTFNITNNQNVTQVNCDPDLKLKLNSKRQLGLGLTQSNTNYFYCGTKHYELFKVRERDWMCDHIDNIIRPERNMTLTLYHKRVEPKQIRAFICVKKKEIVKFYVNIVGDRFTEHVTKIIEVSPEDCWKIVHSHKCSEGKLSRQGESRVVSTKNPINIEFPNPIIGLRVSKL